MNWRPASMSGFGNGSETAALPGALPAGRNLPKGCLYGLDADQRSGSPFTAPRATNERSCLYRIRPTVKHRGALERAEARLPHGPDAHTFEHASSAVFAPRKLEGTMAFMFESRPPQRVSRFGAKIPQRQARYVDCWADVRKLFNPDQP